MNDEQAYQILDSILAIVDKDRDDLATSDDGGFKIEDYLKMIKKGQLLFEDFQAVVVAKVGEEQKRFTFKELTIAQVDSARSLARKGSTNEEESNEKALFNFICASTETSSDDLKKMPFAVYRLLMKVMPLFL